MGRGGNGTYGTDVTYGTDDGTACDAPIGDEGDQGDIEGDGLQRPDRGRMKGTACDERSFGDKRELKPLSVVRFLLFLFGEFVVGF